jgi:hypothetical protein
MTETTNDFLNQQDAEAIAPSKEDQAENGHDKDGIGAEGHGTNGKEAWGEPADILGTSMEAAVPFPETFLPGALKGYAEDAAERMQGQLDLVGIPLIIGASTAIGKEFRMRNKNLDDWLEMPCLWGGAIAGIGQLKTPSFNAGLAPLNKLQMKFIDEHIIATEEYREKVRRARFAEKKWEKDCKAAVKKGEEGMPTRPAEADPPPAPIQKRLLTSNFTQEKLVELMAENPRGFLAYRDELSGWFATFNQYRKGDDRQFYLTCHAGGVWPQDRKIGSAWLKDLYLNVFGGFQPGIVAKVLAADDPDGMTARFSLLVWPDESLDFKYIDRAPHAESRKGTEEAFEKLFKLSAIDFFGLPGVTPDYLRSLSFDDAARGVFTDWYTPHMRAQRSGRIDEYLRAHYSKYSGLFGRLAIVHHLLRYVQGIASAPALVDEVTAIAVRDFIDKYLAPHARRIYRHLGRSPAYHGARRIAAWIVAEKKTGFVARDVRRKEWAGLTDQEGINKALDYLEHVARWVRSQDQSSGARGGRPTTRYDVNPKSLDLYTPGRKNGLNGSAGAFHM